MAQLISQNWPILLEPGLRAIFELARQPIIEQSRIPNFFNVTTSQKAQEHDQGLGGMSDWNEYGGQIEYDDTELGYKVTYTHKEYAKGIAIERKLVDDDMYNIINNRVSLLALTAERTREKHGASVFDLAFSSAQVGGDSKPLCASDHPASPVNATTQSNAGSTALSYDSIIATRKLMRAFKDDTGELTPIMPDTILVPPALEETAYYATRAVVEPTDGTTASEPTNPNYVRSKGFNVVVWDYLSDTNNWFMIDSSLGKRHLHWFNRVPLEFAFDPTGGYDLVARYRGYMRYSYGFSDWRWIYGHAVA
jgi:phage major head subunit gpT-like protein